MELEELIENTLRRKHLEEMMNRPEKEHTPLEGAYSGAYPFTFRGCNSPSIKV